jgi:dTDP-4-amino-4,6-dideoxygalactose transaminase
MAGAYKHLGFSVGSFPIAEQLTSTLLSLPIGPQQSNESTDRIIAAVREACLAGIKL